MWEPWLSDPKPKEPHVESRLVFLGTIWVTVAAALVGGIAVAELVIPIWDKFASAVKGAPQAVTHIGLLTAAVFIGASLTALKKRALGMYALLELAFGSAASWAAMSVLQNPTTDDSFKAALAILASFFSISKGFENLAEAKKKQAAAAADAAQAAR